MAAELLRPGPVIETEVALAVLQEIVEEPGAVAVVGVALIAADTIGAAALTVTVAVRVIGPPLPCAVSVYVYVPAARLATVWVPLVAELARPGPLTETDVAFDVPQEIVEEPGAVVVVGLALIDPETEAGALTVNVAVCVTGPPEPCAVIV